MNKSNYIKISSISTLLVVGVLLSGVSAVLADDSKVSVTTNQNTYVLSSVSSTDVTLNITDDREAVKPGEVLTYRIVVKNPKQDDATGVKVVAHVSEYLVPQATNPVAVADPQSRTITWNNQTISAGATVTFAFRAQVQVGTPAGFVLNNQAEINGSGVRASATDTTTVQGQLLVSAPVPVITPTPVVAVHPTAKTGSTDGVAVAVLEMLVGLGGGLGVFLRRG